METKKLQAGDVVLAMIPFGRQLKCRPAIVIEVCEDEVYLSLGSTKNLINDRHSFVVNEADDMQIMGLRHHTRFGFGNEADQWVPPTLVKKLIGQINRKVALQMGQAWANSRFVRAS